MKTNLSTAIAHLLSIRSDAVTNVAGKANAATSVLSTVIMAPSFINLNAISAKGDNIVTCQLLKCHL